MNLKLTRRDFLKGTAAAAAMEAFNKSPLAKIVPQNEMDFLLSEPTFLGLGTAVPGGLREVDVAGYKRSGISFEPAEDGLRNRDPVMFSQALGSWGMISHAGIFSNGELIAVADFDGRSWHISNGDNVQVDNICLEVG